MRPQKTALDPVTSPYLWSLIRLTSYLSCLTNHHHSIYLPPACTSSASPLKFYIPTRGKPNTGPVCISATGGYFYMAPQSKELSRLGAKARENVGYRHGIFRGYHPLVPWKTAGLVAAISLSKWLNRKSRFRSFPLKPCAVHCIVGLDRAPVFGFLDMVRR